MATAAPQPNKGVSLENVAEEVLNGLFCHYEPPTTEDSQRKAAEEASRQSTTSSSFRNAVHRLNEKERVHDGSSRKTLFFS